MRAVALVVLVAAIAAGAVVSRVRLERGLDAGPVEQELLYLPNGRYLKLASLGHGPLVADLVYLWAIQFYSNYERTGRHRYVEHIFGEVIPDLDPWYIDPYWVGAMILVVEVGDLEAGLRLLDLGFRHNPDAWILPYLAGWEAERAGQPIRAAEYFARASRVEGAPSWVRRMEAGMLARAGRTEEAIRMWQAVYDDPESDDWGRAIAERWIRTLRTRREIEGLDAAVASFRERYDRLPRALQELVRVGLLPGLPQDPDGAPYGYDPESGRVTSAAGRILGLDR